jgi:hypothetical protein
MTREQKSKGEEFWKLQKEQSKVKTVRKGQESESSSQKKTKRSKQTPTTKPKEEPKEFDIRELNRLDDIEIEEMSNDWATMSHQIKPKQETLEEPCVQCCGTGEIQKSTNRKQSNFECDICSGRGYWNKLIEPKQEETIEEAAEKLYPVHINSILDKYDDGVINVIGEEDINEDCRESFIEGAKWQQEQIGKSEFLQKLRATLSDAEARRLIFETFKKK